LLLIGQFHNSLQLPIVNEPRAGVHVTDERDAQSVELRRPIFYLHFFFMNDETFGSMKNAQMARLKRISGTSPQ
jgi:hypothetical protein